MRLFGRRPKALGSRKRELLAGVGEKKSISSPSSKPRVALQKAWEVKRGTEEEGWEFGRREEEDTEGEEKAWEEIRRGGWEDKGGYKRNGFSEKVNKKNGFSEKVNKKNGFGKKIGRVFGRGKEKVQYYAGVGAVGAAGAAGKGWRGASKGVGFAGGQTFGRGFEYAKGKYQEHEKRGEEEQEFWERVGTSYGVENVPPSLREEMRKGSREAFKTEFEVKNEARRLGIPLMGRPMKFNKQSKVYEEDYTSRVMSKSVAQLKREIVAHKHFLAEAEVKGLATQTLKRELKPGAIRRTGKIALGSVKTVGRMYPTVKRSFAPPARLTRGEGGPLRAVGAGTGRLKEVQLAGIRPIGREGFIRKPGFGVEGLRNIQARGLGVGESLGRPRMISLGGEKIRAAGIMGPRLAGGETRLGSAIGRTGPRGSRLTNLNTMVGRKVSGSGTRRLPLL